MNKVNLTRVLQRASSIRSDARLPAGSRENDRDGSFAYQHSVLLHGPRKSFKHLVSSASRMQGDHVVYDVDMNSIINPFF